MGKKYVVIVLKCENQVKAQVEKHQEHEILFDIYRSKAYTYSY
ncbi:hypothetical protein HMPREF1982_02357 [Clostridiales bacterium oral taxon 876 str. F0540]|nr:hypothetical protein HMPREF1982_02357 [Clostridiales bacterium oral taxon 876 str. F0540]